MMWKLSTIGGAAAVSFRHSNSMHSLVSGWSCSDDLHCLQHEHCEGYDAKKEGVCRPKPCDDDKHCDSNSLVCIKPCDMPGDTTGCDSSAKGHCTKKCGYATNTCKTDDHCGTNDHCDDQEKLCHLDCHQGFTCLTSDSLSVCASDAKIIAHQRAADAKVAADNADKVKAAVDIAKDAAIRMRLETYCPLSASFTANNALAANAGFLMSLAKEEADKAKDDADKAKVAADKEAALYVI